LFGSNNSTAFFQVFVYILNGHFWKGVFIFLSIFRAKSIKRSVLYLFT
jgi:hypothetical protein